MTRHFATKPKYLACQERARGPEDPMARYRKELPLD